MSSSVSADAERGSSPRLPAIAQHLLVVAGFVVVSILLTYPMVVAGPNTIVGTRIAQKDGWQTIWDLWWFGTALQQGEHPLWTRHIFWPLGVDLQVYEAYGISTLVQSLPALLPFGPVAAYRWNMIANFTLSGYMMTLVARHYTRQWLPALAAGIVFTASPFHLARFADGYDDLTALQWLPVYVATLAAWLHGGRWRWGIASVALLTLIYFTALYYAQFAIIWTAAAWAVYSIATRRPVRTALRTALVLGGWALLCAPLLLPNLRTGISYRDYLNRQETHSVDLLDLVLPSDIHPFWRMFDPHRITHLYGSWNVVPGIAILLVGCYGLWRTRRTSWPFTALALIMLAFAMGPTLHIGGVQTGIPLPHQLLNLSSIGQASQRPNHFLVFTIVVLSFGVAFALRGRSTRTVVLLTLVMVVVDCLPPVPWPRIVGTPPPWLPTLAAVSDSALLELPVRTREIDYQYNQLWHGRPVTGGYVSRVPPDPLIELPILQQLSGEADPTVLGGDERTQLHTAIRASCASLIVLHDDRQPLLPLAATQEKVESLLPEARLLAPSPLIYQLPMETYAPRALLLPGFGWYPLEYDDTRRWQWTAPDSTFDLANPFAVPITVQLDIEIEGASDGRTVTLDAQGATWQQRLTSGTRRTTVFVELHASERRTLRLRADPLQETVGNRRVLGVVVREATATVVQPTEAELCPPTRTLPAALGQP